VVAEAVVEPSERVAWLQWPVTLAELRLQVNRSRGDLAADMSAPVASALSETRALLATNSSVISQPVRSSLEAVLALLDSAAGRFASAGVDISVEADAAVDDSALFEFVHTLETVTAVLQSELERWRMLGALAAVIGVLALVLLGVAAWLRRSDADESGVVLEAGSAQRQHVAVVRRMADDSKRDYGIARALVQAGGKRLELLRALSANADELSGNAARLAKPRELVLRLGRQHAASQRTLVNQMATTTARLSETRKLATQWAERSDETQRLIQSLRELGERAALLQVNARIRVSSADAGLAEDFQRLNDSVLGVMAQTETLARRQSDASRRTLDGLRRSVEAQSAVEATASTAASQLRAYVNGQQDLSGRYDKLDSLLTAHARALDGLQKRAKSDQALEQRALKANRAAAKFASQAGQGDQPVTPASRTVPAARSAPQRPRRCMAAIADNGTDAHELAVVLPILIQTRDVCAVTGLNGPHLLLVEMVRVVEGVIEGDYEHPIEANNALMFAAARLPGYIHRLLLGGRDLPLALLPVLNDLRAVRGAPLLSDAVMRLPLFRLPPDDLGASNAEDGLAAAARQVRPHYMRALLNLIRGEAAAGSLELIAGCLKTLRDHSRRRSVRMLWLIARGLVDGLHSGSLELKPATKSLLGQIDQCIKLAVVHGERDLVVSLPPELLRSLLFYCAQAGDASDVLRVVRQRYQLEDIGRLAASEDGALERAAQLPAPGLLYAARDQVLEELDRVRDAVLAFAHSDVSPAETLQPAGLLLERVCETLGVLGFSAARTTLNASLPMFQRIRDRHTSARALGTLAEVLLQGGRLLDAELDRQSGADDDLDCSQELDVDQSALTRMPREERRQLLAAVLVQLRAALDAFESAVVAHRSGDVSPDVLLTACDGLRDASRALDIVPLRAAHDAFQRLVGWLDHTLATATDLSDLSESHALVEAVAGLDFYLRAMAENDLNGRGFLRACFTALTSLEQDVSFQSAQTDEHDTVEPISPVSSRASTTSPSIRRVTPAHRISSASSTAWRPCLASRGMPTPRTRRLSFGRSFLKKPTS